MIERIEDTEDFDRRTFVRRLFAIRRRIRSWRRLDSARGVDRARGRAVMTFLETGHREVVTKAQWDALLRKSYVMLNDLGFLEAVLPSRRS